MNNILHRLSIIKNETQTPIMVFVFMLALACLATFPAVLNLAGSLIGYHQGDSYEMMWVIWWLKQALFNSTLSVAKIPLLFHPQGINLPLLNTQIGAHLLALPFGALYNVVAAYNITMIVSLALSGTTAYFLGMALTGNKLASAMCGLVWAFFPNKMGHALSGHLYQVAVFWLPLYVLCLLRVLNKPSLRSGVMAGVMAVLVASVHSVHTVYFLLPLTIVILGRDWMQNISNYWSRDRVVAFGSSLAIFLVFLGPAYIPVFTQAIRGEMEYMPVTGMVGFSVDLMSFFLPAPENPLLSLLPRLRELSSQVNVTYSESIAYLGIVPVALACLGVHKNYRALTQWLVLGSTTMVLSLGPLLKFGGKVVETQIDKISSPIVLPYALLANLPFFQWSRTPARIHATTHLVLAVLVAYGAAMLLEKIKIKWHRIGITCFLSTIIFLEYLVVFPFPLIYTESRKVHAAVNTGPGAVLPLPVTNGAATEALFGQTINGRPIIGGRLFRDMPKSNTTQRFLQNIVLGTELVTQDIVAVPDNKQRLGVLRAYDAGWVTYHTPDDEIGLQIPKSLEALLGPPISTSDKIALFAVGSELNQSEHLGMVYALGANWHPLEYWNNTPTRWFYDNGELYVYSSSDQEATLSMTLVPELKLHVVAVKVNGDLVMEIAAGDWLQFKTPPFPLNAGLNVVELVDLNGSRTYVGDLRCAGGTPLSGVFIENLECDPGVSGTRLVSVGVQKLEIVSKHVPKPIQAQFGNNIKLLESHWQTDLEAGKPLRVTLYWSAEEPMTADWTNFIHVRGPDNQVVSGLDQQPMKGSLPTSDWSPGQVVAYSLIVPIPDDAPRGKYAIDVGWYQWPSLERMHAESRTFPVDHNLLRLGEATLR